MHGGTCEKAPASAAAGKESMGKKDILARSFFSDPERFAELINVRFFQGKEILSPGHLISVNRKYPSLSGTSGEKERDVLMKDQKNNILYGLEIEEEPDYSMPERVMVYGACEYEHQIQEIHKKHRKKQDYKKYREWKSRMKEADFLIPTITVVLYLGEEHWEGRRKLSQMFRFPEEIRKLFDPEYYEYGFPLIEADFENPEFYRTDLREFFQAMQCRREKKRLANLFRTEAFQKLDPETERMIAAHMNIKRLVHKMEEEELPMCKAFQDLMREERQSGKREGRREGKKEGKQEEKILIIRRMLQEGMDKKQISRLTRCTIKELAEARK